MAKNKDMEGDEMLDGSLPAQTGEPRVYELGFHLDPELPTEEVKKAYQGIRDFIASKSDIVAESAPEKIQLAYTISRQETTGRRDFDSACFSWVVYEATPEAHAEVVSLAGGEKRVVRFIDLLTTKEAARHALEMQELALKTPEVAEEAGAAAGAELDAALENATI
jgi:ribosomal protein S6